MDALQLKTKMKNDHDYSDDDSDDDKPGALDGGVTATYVHGLQLDDRDLERIRQQQTIESRLSGMSIKPTASSKIKSKTTPTSRYNLRSADAFAGMEASTKDMAAHGAKATAAMDDVMNGQDYLRACGSSTFPFIDTSSSRTPTVIREEEMIQIVPPESGTSPDMLIMKQAELNQLTKSKLMDIADTINQGNAKSEPRKLIVIEATLAYVWGTRYIQNQQESTGDASQAGEADREATGSAHPWNRGEDGRLPIFWGRPTHDDHQTYLDIPAMNDLIRPTGLIKDGYVPRLERIIDWQTYPTEFTCLFHTECYNEYTQRLNRDGLFAILSPNFAPNGNGLAFCFWCSELLPSSSFTKSQLQKGPMRQICIDCKLEHEEILLKKKIEASRQTGDHNDNTGELHKCKTCREELPRSMYTKTQLRHSQDSRRCMNCISDESSRQISAFKRKDPPAATEIQRCKKCLHECPYCRYGPNVLNAFEERKERVHPNRPSGTKKHGPPSGIPDSNRKSFPSNPYN